MSIFFFMMIKFEFIVPVRCCTVEYSCTVPYLNHIFNPVLYRTKLLGFEKIKSIIHVSIWTKLFFSN